MIISDNDGEPAAPDTSTFTLVSTDKRSGFSLHVANALTDDLREHLAAHGFRVPEGQARSATSEIVVATAGNPAAWTAVGATIVAFLRRHRGKAHRIEVDGKSISIDGYSAREVRKLTKDLLNLTTKPIDRGDSGTGPDSKR